MCFFLFLAGILIYIETNQGTLRIESQADNVPIRIVQGNQTVKQLTLNKSGTQVRLQAGEYTIEFEGQSDGLLVDRNHVTLKRGMQSFANVEFIPKPRPSSLKMFTKTSTQRNLAKSIQPIRILYLRPPILKQISNKPDGRLKNA